MTTELYKGIIHLLVKGKKNLKTLIREKMESSLIKSFVENIGAENRSKDNGENQSKMKKVNISTDQFKILFWRTGKKYFKELNRSFIVDEENKHFLDLVARYFTQDISFETDTGGELRKGLFIHGPCGTGKSSVFDIIRNLCVEYNLMQYWFSNVSVHDVVTEFNKHGEQVVEKYSRGTVHFDDLGTEKMVQLWGIKENLLTRILQIRYNNFKDRGTKTFVTTNHSLQDFKKIYGVQVYDRIFEMFNIMELGGKSRRF